MSRWELAISRSASELAGTFSRSLAPPARQGDTGLLHGPLCSYRVPFLTALSSAQARVSFLFTGAARKPFLQHLSATATLWILFFQPVPYTSLICLWGTFGFLFSPLVLFFHINLKSLKSSWGTIRKKAFRFEASLEKFIPRVTIPEVHTCPCSQLDIRPLAKRIWMGKLKQLFAN